MLIILKRYISVETFRKIQVFFSWQAVESINSLLDKAKDEIPQDYWTKTPLVLRATAGLRLLPQEKAENLLNSMRQLFRATPFLTDDDSVAIMDGTDEGIFSWFTVNFLLG